MNKWDEMRRKKPKLCGTQNNAEIDYDHHRRSLLVHKSLLAFLVQQSSSSLSSSCCKKNSSFSLSNHSSFLLLLKEKNQDDGDIPSLKKSIEDLLQHMNNDNNAHDSSDRSLFSNYNIASLLLPWAMESILNASSSKEQDDDDHDTTLLSWRALASSLHFLVQNDDGKSTNGTENNTFLLSVTTSTWNKILSSALKCALAKKSEGDKSMKDAACTCYCIIANHSSSSVDYSPTMDFICHSLLQYISSSSTTTANNASPSTKMELQLIQATFQLLSRFLVSSFVSHNPKKTFYLLTTPTVCQSILKLFSRLIIHQNTKHVDIETCANNIWYYGLFDPYHHLDGFVRLLSSSNNNNNNNNNSMNKSSYQQQLFTTLHSAVNQCDTSQKDDTIVALAVTIPFLLEAFIIQMKGWEDDRKQQQQEQENDTIVQINKKKRKKRKQSSETNPYSSFSQNTLQLLFRFTCQIMKPILDILKKLQTEITTSNTSDYGINSTDRINIVGYVFQAIHKSFHLLSKYDIYHSSYEDSKMKRFEFLNDIVCMILQVSENLIESQSKEQSCTVYQVESIYFFQEVLKLNHHLLHHNLHRLLKLTSTILSSKVIVVSVDEHDDNNNNIDNPPTRNHENKMMLKDETPNLNKNIPAVTNLLCQIIDTYQKLRQLSEFVKSLLKTFTTTTNVDNNIHKIIKEDKIILALTNAIHNSPLGQIEEVWNILNGFILQKEFSSDHENNKLSYQIQFATDILILVTKSVCVGKSSASHLRTLCENTIETLVTTLIKGNKDHDISHATDDHMETDFSFDQLMNQVSNNNEDSNTTLRFALLKNGLDLCGWMVALHTKCYFWQNQVSNDSAGVSLLNKEILGGKSSSSLSVIPSILEGARKMVKNHRENENKDTNSRQNFDKVWYISNSLTHLSSYRIQQLHSMIYQQEQYEGIVVQTEKNKDNRGEKTSTDMIQEASLLVDFVVYIAINRQLIGDHKNNKSGNDHNLKNDYDQSQGMRNIGWKMLSQMIGSWTPYSSPSHIKSYLTWFFSVISYSEEYFLKNIEKKYHYLPMIKENLSTIDLKEETQLCRTIIQDASFFEIEQIVDQFISIGIPMAYDLLVRSVVHSTDVDDGTKMDNGDTRVEIKLGNESIQLTSLNSDIIQQLDSNERTMLLFERFIRDTSSKSRLTIDGKAYTGGNCCDISLGQALHLLKILNSLPSDIYLSNHTQIVLNMYIKIHSLVRTLLQSSREPQTNNDMYVKILCCSKDIVVKHLSQQNLLSPSSKIPPCENGSKIIRLLLNFEFDSMKLILRRDKPASIRDFCGIALTTSRKVFRELLLYSVNLSSSSSSKNSNAKVFQVFQDYLTEKVLEITTNSDTDRFPRPHIHFFISYFQTVIFMSECGSRNFHQKRKDDNDIRLRDVCFETVSSVKKILLQSLFSDIKNDLVARKMMEKNGYDTVLLLSYIIKYLGHREEEKINLKELLELDDDSCGVFQRLLSYAENNVIEVSNCEICTDMYKMKSVFIHLLCNCISFAESSPDLFSSQSIGMLPMNLMLLQQGGEVGKFDPLVESSFIDYISSSTGDHISSLCLTLFGHLQREEDVCISPQRATAALYCFHLMIMIAKGQSQKDGLIDYIRPFLHLSIEVQHFACGKSDVSHRVQESNIRISQSFIKTIIMKKDLLTLNIGEISLILARLNRLFRFENKCSKRNEVLFVMSCDVILALFKHYPKQLYGSCAVLMSTIRSLLYFLMSESIIRKRPIVPSNDEKYQKFSKICELLMVHKEVYKKHVVGLIVGFVTYMQDKHFNGKKDLLLQSVYILLDCLSNHEQDELNAKMDPKSKSMFRSVHQSYQKNHQYKGKF